MEMKNSSGSTDNLGTETGFSDTDNGGSGFECKTCGKRFTSFQALGGHQGIHRKAKSMMSEDDDDDLCLLSLDTEASSSSLLHRCKICMKEFTSGQALGGHMTRHRVVEKAFNLPTETERRLRRQEENVESDVTVGLRRLKEEEEDGRRRHSINVVMRSELALAAKEWRLYL